MTNSQTKHCQNGSVASSVVITIVVRAKLCQVSEDNGVYVGEPGGKEVQ